MKSSAKPQPAVKKPNPGNWKAEDWLNKGASLDEINEMKEAFDLFDTDLGGSIDTKGIAMF